MVPQIRTKRLAYVHYQLPDIDQAATFLNDFGMIEASRSGSKIYYRGFDTQPYIYIAEQSPTHERKFLGGTWVVESALDLETAARHPQATPIRDNDGPGGGKVVTIKDPNGMLVSFISGQAPRARDGEEEINRRASGERAVPINSPLETTRVGQFQRFKPGPSPVFKLGHYGYIVPKSRYEETVAWYRELMNVTPSDIVYDPATGKDQSVFLHIDKGLDYSDHHSLFFSAGPEEEPTHVHHSSFEVNDFDTQSLGHYWLQEKGYTNCWGMGRHVLGSQIFDYWFDASGNVVEHYSDSDLVNKNSAVTREPAAHDTLHVWGPNVPLAFVTANMADAKPNHWVPDPRVVTKGEENGVNEMKHQANA